MDIQKSKIDFVCGVIQTKFDTETGKEETKVKYIYKTWYQGKKICLWATVEDLYKYGLQPVKQNIEAWDSTFMGFLYNGYEVFLAPAFTMTKNPNPLPVEEDGAIPNE